MCKPRLLIIRVDVFKNSFEEKSSTTSIWTASLETQLKMDEYVLIMVGMMHSA